MFVYVHATIIRPQNIGRVAGVKRRDRLTYLIQSSTTTEHQQPRRTARRNGRRPTTEMTNWSIINLLQTNRRIYIKSANSCIEEILSFILAVLPILTILTYSVTIFTSATNNC